MSGRASKAKSSHERLNGNWSRGICEARHMIEEGGTSYNYLRFHGTLDGMTSIEYTAKL